MVSLKKADPYTSSPAAGFRGTPSGAVTTASPWTAAGSPVVSGDVERLTEEVIRQLDRRVVAWRERRGKI
ncbi:MAG TPA: hypothetical protein VKA21_00185 [Candidatus Binatia bacterium]|nr:hypothetical protein [Candidatus Binatia bacterium]